MDLHPPARSGFPLRRQKSRERVSPAPREPGLGGLLYEMKPNRVLLLPRKDQILLRPEVIIGDHPARGNRIRLSNDREGIW